MLTFKGIALKGSPRFGRALTKRQIAAGMAMKQFLICGVQLDRQGVMEYTFTETKRYVECTLTWEGKDV